LKPPGYYGEKFNAVTHLVGAVLSLAGAIVLVVLAAVHGDPWKVVSVPGHWRDTSWEKTRKAGSDAEYATH